jgi:hypothetical protein
MDLGDIRLHYKHGEDPDPSVLLIHQTFMEELFGAYEVTMTTVESECIRSTVIVEGAPMQAVTTLNHEGIKFVALFKKK